MKSSALNLRRWLRQIPIGDLVERRMASLVQVILLGFMAVILIATVVNLLIATDIPWQEILIRTAIFISVLGLPLTLSQFSTFYASMEKLLAILHSQLMKATR